MNCPSCGHDNEVNDTSAGLQRCRLCASPLPRALSGTWCANHPQVQAVGTCVRCGSFACSSCLALRNAGWLCSKCQSRLSPIEWDQRDELGVWRAWWKTSMQMISSPQLALERAEPNAPLSSSLHFALLSAVVGFVPTLLVSVLVTLTRGTWSGGAGSQGISAWVQTATSAFMLIAFQFAEVMFGSGLEHGCLKLLGAKPKTYSVTVRAHALAMGPYVLGLIPGCGFYIFPIWSLVVRIIANHHLHRTSAGKATGAVLLPIGLGCGGLLAFWLSALSLAKNLGH